MTIGVEHVGIIRGQLSARRKSLKSSVDSQINALILENDVEQGGMDTGDAANHAVESDVQLDRAHRESYELSLVEYALDRIESGDFGLCANCNRSIDVNRLLANPIAKRCLDCQDKHEDLQDERDSTPSL
jgi:RNA polymerase-binding protein DksA